MTCMVDHAVSVSPAALWQVMSDLERWPEHLPTVDAVEPLDPQGPIGVGSRFRLRQPGIPAATYEITAWEPDRGFVWETRSPGVRAIARHRITSDATGSRLRLSVTWEGVLAPLMRLLLKRKAQRYVETEATTFAALAAAREGESRE